MRIIVNIAKARERSLAMGHDPKFFILESDQVEELVEEMRLSSAMPMLGFDRRKCRDAIIDGTLTVHGLRPIIAENIAS